MNTISISDLSSWYYHRPTCGVEVPPVEDVASLAYRGNPLTCSAGHTFSPTGLSLRSRPLAVDAAGTYVPTYELKGGVARLTGLEKRESMPAALVPGISGAELAREFIRAGTAALSDDARHKTTGAEGVTSDETPVKAIAIGVDRDARLALINGHRAVEFFKAAIRSYFPADGVEQLDDARHKTTGAEGVTSDETPAEAALQRIDFFERVGVPVSDAMVRDAELKFLQEAALRVGDLGYEPSLSAADFATLTVTDSPGTGGGFISLPADCRVNLEFTDKSTSDGSDYAKMPPIPPVPMSVDVSAFDRLAYEAALLAHHLMRDPLCTRFGERYEVLASAALEMALTSVCCVIGRTASIGFAAEIRRLQRYARDAIAMHRAQAEEEARRGGK